MPLMTLAIIQDALAGGFGIAAAVLLIGGGVALRWQRNRLHYALMQSALDKGVDLSAAAPPAWLISLRQGVSTFAIGIGLLVAATVVHRWSQTVPMPAVSEFDPQQQRDMNGPPGGEFLPPGPNGPEDGPPDGPPRRGNMMPNQRPGAPLAGQPGRPPRANPAMERWHRAQDQIAVARAAGAAGLVLVLLGAVRIIFSFAEKRYTPSRLGDLSPPVA